MVKLYFGICSYFCCLCLEIVSSISRPISKMHRECKKVFKNVWECVRILQSVGGLLRLLHFLSASASGTILSRMTEIVLLAVCLQMTASHVSPRSISKMILHPFCWMSLVVVISSFSWPFIKLLIPLQTISLPPLFWHKPSVAICKPCTPSTDVPGKGFHSTSCTLVLLT